MLGADCRRRGGGWGAVSEDMEEAMLRALGAARVGPGGGDGEAMVVNQGKSVDAARVVFVRGMRCGARFASFTCRSGAAGMCLGHLGARTAEML